MVSETAGGSENSCKFHWQAGRVESVSSFKRAFVSCVSQTDLARLVSDKLTSLSSSLVAHRDMNSCGVVHGKSCGVTHVYSSGATAHGNSRVDRGQGVVGGTKPWRTSARSMAWRLAVRNLLLYSRRQAERPGAG